jgi:hypothetical protein
MVELEDELSQLERRIQRLERVLLPKLANNSKDLLPRAVRLQAQVESSASENRAVKEFLRKCLY